MTGGEKRWAGPPEGWSSGFVVYCSVQGNDGMSHSLTGLTLGKSVSSSASAVLGGHRRYTTCWKPLNEQEIGRAPIEKSKRKGKESEENESRWDGQGQ